MKKALQTAIIAIFLCFGTLNIFAQNYIPFPDSNAVWNGNRSECCGPYITNYFDYQFKQDTLINSKYYHIIGSKNSNYYDCAIRQDTALKQVFVIYLNKNIAYMNDSIDDCFDYDNTEYLLYDFNLELGDSIEIYSKCRLDTYLSTLKDEIIKFYVISVDTELINGINRKVIQIRAGDTSPFYVWSIWYEGIGSVFGPIYTQTMPDFEMNFSLTCMQQNNEILYGGFECFVIAEELKDYENQIQIFPNPTKDILNFRINNSDACELFIYNNLGQIVFSKTVRNEEQINVQNLNSGLYYLKISNNEKTFFEKILIEK